MKSRALLNLIILANTIAINFIGLKPLKANTFDEKEVNPQQVIAVVAPFRHGYNLVVIEQIEGKDQCWKEFGNNPVVVDPLWMNFDFTSHCNRATDTNGYSIRMEGKEYGTDYLLSIVEEDAGLHLIATPRDPRQSPLKIGSTHGSYNGGFAKIFLNSGWRFTRRAYQGQELSHFYFSHRLNPEVISRTVEVENEPSMFNFGTSTRIEFNFGTSTRIEQ